jgi:(2Fe-2S) ferredoxin
MRGLLRLVVCVNQRLGSGQRSCAGSGSLDLVARIESLIEAENIDVPIVRRECLGRCEEGPVMRIAPGGAFYTEIDETALELIVAELKRALAGGHVPQA